MTKQASDLHPVEDISRSYMDIDSKEYDLEKACSMLTSLSIDGDENASYLYSIFLLTGTVITKDLIGALELMSRSADAGNKDAIRTLNEIKNSDGDIELLVRLKFKGLQRDKKACAELFDIYDNGKRCVKKDHAEAIRWYTVNAEKGDEKAQDTIGFMYLMGKGVPKDLKKADLWLMASARSGNADAMFHLADAYYKGTNGVKPSLKNALKWYEASAVAGHPEAQHDLAVISIMARRPNFKKAVELFTKAADQGEKDSIYQLGILYAYGEGVLRDPPKATELLIQACELGHSEAMFTYADMKFEGQVLEKNLAEAAKWFRKSADLCNATAEYCLACMYGNGSYFDKDDEKAAELFKNAAEAGEPNSQYALACFCFEGRVAPKDEEQAAMWFDVAAEQGHPAAKAFYGMMTITGVGTKADVNAGLRMIKEVAKTGFPDGLYYLGKLYLDGTYVKKNIPLAKKYLKQAVEKGDMDASLLFEQLSS